MPDPLIHYHDRTKHHLHRYARSPGYMDWRNQPNPFRFWNAPHIVGLPFLSEDMPADHGGLYMPQQIAAQPLTRATLGGMLELSLALSAWKAYGNNRWSLRINPSSGNLHPTEAHLSLPQTDGVAAGIYHYAPFHHVLERRCRIDESIWRELQRHFGTRGFLIGLTSIFWRESWKYGERAYRYCNHDVGHALAALAFAANLNGWRLECLTGPGDGTIEAVLGFDRVQWPPLEGEHPDIMCFVGLENHNGPQPLPSTLPDTVIRALAAGSFEGRPNRLSESPVDWPIIYETARRARKPDTAAMPAQLPSTKIVYETKTDLKAARVIRQRRSATAFDPQGLITDRQFMAILDKTLPRKGTVPFNCRLDQANVHLLVFVHQVSGLPRGLYVLCRNDAHLGKLREDLHQAFIWQKAADDLPLYLLKEADMRGTAIQVSCHQDIAGESAFSLGMLARFETVIKAAPYRYRHLFWETGLIGQVLYLEAEAQGLRGTGIGCFFDDEVHRIAGLKGHDWQSLYHFTVGCPIDDSRLTTLPPYDHLENRDIDR